MEKKIIIGIIILILMFGALLITKSKITGKVVELGDNSYEELCKKNRDVWMEMEFVIDGKKISDEKCFGCMIDDNHFCKVNEYIEHIKGFSNGEEINDKMMHNAMTAHAGDEDSVDVMMYNVDFERGNFIVGNPTELKFNIKDSMTGESVSDLEIMHEKIMHVVLVRNDLKYFDHVHPQKIEKGVFVVSYIFSAPGKYRIWIDFTKDGMQHIVDFDIIVSGDVKYEESDRTSGLNIEMTAPQNIETNEPSIIEFAVRDENNNLVKITEKFLAANAHMIVINKSLDEFGHSHDEKIDGDNILSFEYVFEKTGPHKLWVQFSVNENVITKEFEVEV